MPFGTLWRTAGFGRVLREFFPTVREKKRLKEERKMPLKDSSSKKAKEHMMLAKKCEKQVKSFQKTVLDVYKKHGRDLPWRKTTDPYAILVSELMLQQTQVPRVIEKYTAFLARFPTPHALAQAPLADVLRLWQGLGYNRRAKFLWEAAQLFITYKKPTQEQFLAQKGIGTYTAAAVCAFAYNQDGAAIDVNVRRVFSRYFGEVDDMFIASAVPKGKSRDWHNALMDFGSLLCTKRSPSCNDCPFAKTCHAVAHNSFAQEKSASQPKFIGSVRWHRGQILKAVLSGVHDKKRVYMLLDKELRTKEKFDKAIQGLLDEQLIRNKQGKIMHA